MKDQPFLLILLVGTGLIIVGLALGIGLGQKNEAPYSLEPQEIIHTKPVLTLDYPVEANL